MNNMDEQYVYYFMRHLLGYWRTIYWRTNGLLPIIYRKP